MAEKRSLDFGWLFHEGDIHQPPAADKANSYLTAKTEHMLTGPASLHYHPRTASCLESWQDVDLPHDYIIAQRPTPQHNNALGYFHYRNAWYRHIFTIPAEDEGKRLVLRFEGVATHATIYLNGCLIARSFTGYTPFEADISALALYGSENLLAVYVETGDHEGWWYEGAGIYRHVWLIVSQPVAVDSYGIWVNPAKEGDSWRLPAEITLRNDGETEADVRVYCQTIDETGRTAADFEITALLPPGQCTVVKGETKITGPKIWDILSPHLYTFRATVFVAGQQTDCAETRFGFRTLGWSVEDGFLLNGRRVQLQGVCCHQDYGLTGKAMPDRVHRYRLRRLKEMGANAYRAAHYPPAEASMDAMDELGILCMDEVRWFSTSQEALEQLEILIKRDRNHPSVVIWSLGNEEPLHAEARGERIARKMASVVRRMDPTRPITTAVCHDPANAPVHNVCDMLGINYNWPVVDKLHANFPDKPVVYAECCAVGTTRGWYLPDDPGRGYLTAYDHPTGMFVVDREDTWKGIMARPWITGGFQWAGIEHRGETYWPRLCSQSGALDLFLQPKDAYYQNMSHWTGAPMIHLLPHWNLPGREGEEIQVWAYTNCAEAELFLNGVSQGRQSIEEYGHGCWTVPYTPGEIRAIGYLDGKEVAEDQRQTTGAPVSLHLRLEDGDLRADGQDMAILTCWCEDAEGRFVPDASPMVHFNTNDLGVIVGTGSDVCDHTPVPSRDRKMRAGLISVAVRCGKTPGTLRVYANSPGLKAVRLDIPLT